MRRVLDSELLLQICVQLSIVDFREISAFERLDAGLDALTQHPQFQCVSPALLQRAKRIKEVPPGHVRFAGAIFTRPIEFLSSPRAQRAQPASTMCRARIY
jgi:hypothetical protein